MSEGSAAPATRPVRRRLSALDRRRQLVGIGLAKIVETPIQDLSMDDVAGEAGISRGLLFHYFPTKTDFYLACISAAGRRILRNTAPDEALAGPEQVEQATRLMIEQIERRRDFYLALVHGHGVADPRVSEVMDSVREGSTDRVVKALGIEERQRAVVRAWWAYTEDRALTWSAVPTGERPVSLSQLVAECVAALHALLSIRV
ncbi:TetR/AcrR family transcriptional regulator [Nocardioides furvisabuli]|uniref:TetR/AcrR family transcriptional regulator n=1 Tax=Nocardioides furvisabuli TaxID=375542 RepID=UPI001E49D166|nr:TetR/AcrR family transcriptional regulator [Nocardioides furvisabuli]